MKKVLTIADSDCSSGAGIQADLKTFSAHAVYGMSVITAVTAQNTQGFISGQDLSKEIIEQQIQAVFDDIEVNGVKIGMVSQAPTIEVIAEQLKYYRPQNVVVDPVMVSKSGYRFLKPEAELTLIKLLLPMALLVTPNIPEAELITKTTIRTIEQMEEAAKSIYEMGPKNVLVKGGRLEDDSIDILYDGSDFSYFFALRIGAKNIHGTDSTLSSAITANLALGHNLNEAISLAKEYINMAVEHSLSIGKGLAGSSHHFYALYKKAGLL